jgi:hypothetical protein
MLLFLTKALVNQLGLGTDMWFVPFDNITQILKVSKCDLKSQGSFANEHVTKDLLRHRTSLPGINRTHEDIDLALLPPHFPESNSPTRHLVHNNTLCPIHHYVRYSNCATVHSNPHRLGALGWRTSWEMHKPERRCLDFCWRQHCPRLDRHKFAYGRD